MQPDQSPRTQASEHPSAEQLHICFHCSGGLAYPLDWSEEGPRHWHIVLRCPECESRREGVFEQGAVERLDDELDRAASLLLGDLKRMTHANMSDTSEAFWTKYCSLGRLGHTDEVAYAIGFLLSERASLINGVVLPATGGLDWFP